MSRRNQFSTALVIDRGGDIEALDTYGYTPMQRMASNNLAVGAKALLDAGADPNFRGKSGQTPAQVAAHSAARDVLRVLQEHGSERKDVGVKRIVVRGAGAAATNGEYERRPAAEVPDGFAAVCREQGWGVDATWRKLGAGRPWFKHKENGSCEWLVSVGGGGRWSFFSFLFFLSFFLSFCLSSFLPFFLSLTPPHPHPRRPPPTDIYHNTADGCWWIDVPSGAGAYKAEAPAHAPPSHGWQQLGKEHGLVPIGVAVFRG